MIKQYKNQSGFILIGALVTIGVLGILGITITKMALTSKNAETKWVLRDKSASLAQSALEKARWEIFETFRDHYNSSPDWQMQTKFDWFQYDNGSQPSTIGTGTQVYSIPQNATFTDEEGETPDDWTDGTYTITVKTFKRDDSRWDVLLSSTAKFVDDDGTEITGSARTVEELVNYSQDAANVFGYAYFINNHGWFYGSTITANGDIRSNGDFHMKYGPEVNGNVVASVNEDNGSTGDVYGSDYSNTDADTYEKDRDSRARPAVPGSYKVKNNHGHGNNVDGVDTSNPGKSKEGEDTDSTVDDENKGIVNYQPLMDWGYDDNVQEYENEKQIQMPLIGNLKDYKSLAKANNGKIYVYNSTLYGSNTITFKGQSYTGYGEVTVDGVYGPNDGADGVADTADDIIAAGPDNIAGTADDGTLVLVGTSSKPILITGPVVCDNDLIIKGNYTGRGSIFSGRNVHIVGDLLASDNADWPLSDSDPESTGEANNEKDMLALAAKGNVIIGDYNSLSSYYMAPPFTQAYTTDPTDYDIGYTPTSGTQWHGDYTAQDGGKRIESTQTITGYETTSGTKDVVWNGSGSQPNVVAGQSVDIDGNIYTVTSVSSDRFLVEREVSSTYSGSITTIQEVGRRYYEPSMSETDFNSILSGSLVKQVDAITYTNHLYTGRLGNDAVFNGTVVSRDEAIIFSNSLTLNWDMRALMDEDGLINTPDNAFLPKGLRKPETLYWRER